MVGLLGDMDVGIYGNGGTAGSTERHGGEINGRMGNGNRVHRKLERKRNT